MPSSLYTERLTLRPYREGDIDHMAVMFADGEVTAHTLLGKRSREQTFDILGSYISYFDARSYGMRAITLASTGAYVGECGVFDSPTGDGRLYLRYALARSAWGMGYALEAASASVNEVFNELGADWLMAGVTPANKGSLRVINKLGFAATRQAVVHGIDFILFELGRDRWSRPI